jgi:hypothetical protein
MSPDRVVTIEEPVFGIEVLVVRIWLLQSFRLGGLENSIQKPRFLNHGTHFGVLIASATSARPSNPIQLVLVSALSQVEDNEILPLTYCRHGMVGG